MSGCVRRTAGAVIIGNEILSGKVHDENTPYLIAQLRELGVSLRRIAVIPDVLDEIGETVQAFSRTYDIVFTSGGVGPTHDDITMEGIARGFGLPLVEHAELIELLRSKHPLGLTPATRRMATIPEGATIAWGGGVRWPTVQLRNVYILPGVPFIFRAKVDALRDVLRAEPFLCHNVYVNLDESVLAPLLDQVLAAHPGLEIGSYPRFDESAWRVRLTLECGDAQVLDAATDALLALVPASEVVSVDRTAAAREA
jgi:molybdenum cofactor synthesis domain-containing protein